MKHKNCIKCGKSLKTLKGQQSGIGPECSKKIAKNIFVKETNNSDYSFVDGEIEWLLNDREYDVVMLFIQESYSRGRFKEIHWADNTPPFIHSIVQSGRNYNTFTTDIKTIPPVAISNLLHDLGYNRAPNNRLLLMEEVWINHKAEATKLENTIGTGLNKDMPCLVAIPEYPDQDDIDQHFENAQQMDMNAGFRDRMNSVNDLPIPHAMAILLFRQGFGMEWQNKLNKSYGNEYFESAYGECFGSRTLDNYSMLLHQMQSGGEWIFNLGDIQLRNPVPVFTAWLNGRLKQFTKREVDSVDYFIMSGVEREQLVEDAHKKVTESLHTNEFRGLADEDIVWAMHNPTRIMEEIYLEAMFWENRVSYDQNSCTAIEAFTRSLFAELNEKDISLPRIVDTWH